MTIRRTIQVAAIAFGLWAALGPVSGILIALWAKTWLILVPVAVLISYAIAVASLFAWKKFPLRLALAISAILLALSLVGLMFDFTDYGQPAPGLWEWINGMSPTASAAILILIVGNHTLRGKALQEVSPTLTASGHNHEIQ
jgi:hypothetical protein